MRGLTRLLLGAGLLWCSGEAGAQAVVRTDEHLDPDRPEAWAMNYFAATSLLTSFGETAAPAPGRWGVALDLGHIPRLGGTQQRVGFNGLKSEDLNKSPVFGRLRLRLGLPANWVAELGYTPPLSIDGVRSLDLVAVALGRRIIERGGYALSGRVLGQHGGAQGDITCPGELAGIPDMERNPYGCQAASRDRVKLHYYGVDLTSAWRRGDWQWHADLGLARTELEVQVDALTYNVRDRSRLVVRDVLPFLAVGARRDIGSRWTVGVEVLHVPLTVKRNPGLPSENDPLTSLRLQLGYRGR